MGDGPSEARREFESGGIRIVHKGITGEPKMKKIHTTGRPAGKISNETYVIVLSNLAIVESNLEICDKRVPGRLEAIIREIENVCGFRFEDEENSNE